MKSQNERENLAQYIARPPISLKKIILESFQGKVLFHTSYNEDVADADILNEYFRENLKLFDAPDFIALLTMHIPPKGIHLIRRYGLYSSLKPEANGSTSPRLIAKIYEIDPMVCPKCASPMKIIVVITDPEEVKKILKHLIKIGKPPPGLDPSSLN